VVYPPPTFLFKDSLERSVVNIVSVISLRFHAFALFHPFTEGKRDDDDEKKMTTDSDRSLSFSLIHSFSPVSVSKEQKCTAVFLFICSEQNGLTNRQRNCNCMIPNKTEKTLRVHCTSLVLETDSLFCLWSLGEKFFFVVESLSVLLPKSIVSIFYSFVSLLL
jgi:hypothetical protein